ncbi:MAG: sugar transferase [Rhabdochlamydiaceae bacterium]|nr:sugar transferase [Rhabdochlamydiaceae bacterium]
MKLEDNITLSLKMSQCRHQPLKRVFDILFSLAALIFGMPLFLAIALLIKLTSRGPVFYCSLRLGKNGKLFNFWKFRTMYVHADLKLKKLLEDNPLLREEWQKYFKLKNDPRHTRIGKFLRKTSLDEFPQFWNVLIGDLSIVGPRPYLPNETDEIKKHISDDFEKLLSVKPGLTGIWQTSGRSHLTFENRVRLDLDYVKRNSFLFDLRLILKTIPMLIFPKGAF